MMPRTEEAKSVTDHFKNPLDSIFPWGLHCLHEQESV